MALVSLSVLGLRGFATRQTLHFAIPNGRAGSGLTVLVGPNNAGKSTIVEAARAFSASAEQSFTEGRRNRGAGDAVCLELTDDQGGQWTLRTVASGGSEAEWLPNRPATRLLALPSRRHFSPYFGKSSYGRTQYAANMGNASTRGGLLDTFSYRLFEIQKNRAGFDDVLRKVLNPVPHWVIDQSDNGNYYLKFTTRGQTHSSEGLGEGLVSLLVLVDSLYDSQDGDVIVIDEPELSLHPAFQRRMSALFAEYSKTRQIIVATHSPYFLDLEALSQGGRVARVHFGTQGSEIAQLSNDTGDRLSRLLRDTHNPHVLGLDAREAFFLDDGLFLVEGQDDVIHYRRIADQLGMHLNAVFFGWGVGGAEKMELVAQILHELGFRRVAGILDSDRAALAARLTEAFPRYGFEAIPAKDVRTKPAREAVPEVAGLLDAGGHLRAELIEPVRALLTRLEQRIADPDVRVG